MTNTGALTHPSFNNADFRTLLGDAPSIAELHLEREGRMFEVWVWGGRQSITLGHLQAVAPLADNLVALDRRYLAAIAAGWADRSQDSVVTYGEHHADADVMTAETLNGILGDQAHTPENIIGKVRFLKASIFADPDEALGLPDNQVAVFDYGLGQDITQYVIAIRVDIGGNILSIDIES
jgi:hypothetical protein